MAKSRRRADQPVPAPPAAPAAPPEADRTPSESKPSRSGRAKPLLMECAFEVCNKVGGIYTVLRSKAPTMVDRWGSRYCLIGPYEPEQAAVEFEEAPLTGPVGQAVKQLRDEGIGAYYGRWLVTGKPNAVLLNYRDVLARLGEIKYLIWEKHDISLPNDDPLMDQCVAFGEAIRRFLTLVGEKTAGRRQLTAHFHEWMAGIAVPMLRADHWPGSIVFTTHATILGRYLAMNSPAFYDHLPYFDPFKEAGHFNIDAQFRFERAAAHGAHVFTTISDVTGEECKYLLGRKPDVLLPNGLNIQRFERLHQLQNLHAEYKSKIHEFTIGHFFSSYTIDLDNTLYFFTSGRYEYKNKGMDLTIESLARLNHRLRATGSDKTVVAFIVTKRPFKSINVNALQSRAMLEEFHTIADAMRDQVGKGLFHAAAEGRIPDLNAQVDEYWMLRLRRAIHAWRRVMPPAIVTHDLVDDAHDEVLNQLRAARLWNQQHDPVKVVYHPDFISPTNPLFGMEYDQFVRGCHLGVFPSYYEPWGYTPLESIALGVPAIASDLSGFGSYVKKLLPDLEKKGLYVTRRRHASFDAAAQATADRMFEFCQLNRRARIRLRNTVEAMSEHFDWHNLGQWYHQAHELAMERVG